MGGRGTLRRERIRSQLHPSGPGGRWGALLRSVGPEHDRSRCRRESRWAPVRQFRLIEVAAGTTVLQPGCRNQGLSVVRTGQHQRIKSIPAGEKTIAEIGHGDVIGESAEIFDEIARASIVTQSRCWLLTLSHDRHAAITRANPHRMDLLRRLPSRAVLPRDDSTGESISRRSEV
ncbi:MAG: hypothetical protein CL908_26980 [Deltaproteobacteria bacterium]|nr:hypothetical protein [Deltaproteobacteria bacterium]